MDMAKTYEPKSFEDRLYSEWEARGYFRAEVDTTKRPFCVMMPPPNITGQLHMGHALNNTLQDILVRFKRMQGYSAEWVPGTDHASIATEVKIVEQMKEEGLTKDMIGRDGFMVRAWEWKEKYNNRIVNQLKKLGSSCDWSRLAFTMDNHLSAAVSKVFVNLYNKGLIYRGSRIINWCPTCKTALSDAEVEYIEHDSNLWHIAYPTVDGEDRLIVATTRPETLFGDTAVAVNPNDERYSHLIGKMLKLPLTDREIPIVADDYVECEFGSGAVKITPAHDPNDFEVGLRHNLPILRVMNDDGTLNELCGERYNTLDRDVARKIVVDDLKEQGYLVKIEPYTHNTGCCYRCHSIVEPIVSKQWFVSMKPLAEPAIEAVKSGEIRFVPERFSKTYFNWMENIKDWCISRQLWWGHRIPAYYCDKCGELVVSETTPDICPKCAHTTFSQDEDVLDTWFSSALWPFSTLGYPDKTAELDYWYPTTVLVTAYDIIFFWVARMIFSGIEHMGQIPFGDVLIHGIVRDEQGRKMSKSLGNGVDPLKVIEEYGADSLRFSLASGIAPGSDTRYIESRVESCRNFINKVWNASRFVLMNCEGKTLPKVGTFELAPEDKWITCRLNDAIAEITSNLEKYEIGMAASRIYDFVWTEFCDWYIEMSKSALYSDDEDLKCRKASYLEYILTQILKLLHPFIPFVTEEIYLNLPNHTDTIMNEEWPSVNAGEFGAEHDRVEFLRDVVRATRNVRAEMNVAPSKKLRVYLVTDVDISTIKPIMLKLINAETVDVVDKATISDKCTTVVISGAEIMIPMGDLVEFDKELIRLEGELANVDKEIKRCEGMLQNERFVSKAPEAVVNAEREKLAKYRETQSVLIGKINEIKAIM
ncbi:MAG: valine--tRNA ligase [Clostridia bacterium]|nr:valine--tRNA ligase [Clostridia bacterium]